MDNEAGLPPGQCPQTISYPLALDGCTVRVLECGRGDDHLVLLHGSGSRADRWSRNLPGLASSGKHVYAIDLPGHGFATKQPDFDYTTPSFAEAVRQAMERLGVARPTIVGTSLGGHVAAYVAVELGVPVTALGLVGATGIVSIQREVSTTVGRITELTDAGVRGKLEMLMFHQQLVTDDWVEEERRINSSPGAQEALMRTADYVATGTDQHLVGGRLATSGIPVIIFWGGEDKWIDPAVGRRIKSQVLPMSPLVILRHAGHAPYRERPHVFNDCLVTFLEAPADYGSEVTIL